MALGCFSIGVSHDLDGVTERLVSMRGDENMLLDIRMQAHWQLLD